MKNEASRNNFQETKKLDDFFEVREIKHPWLKSRCNFSVRYIVPNTVGILNIMAQKKRLSLKVPIFSLLLV
jgi:hypothetical protein